MSNNPVDNSIDFEKEEWYGGGGETEKVALVDNASGQKIIMRVFNFQLPPLKPEDMPTNEQLLEAHKSRLITFLWRDELVPVMDMKVVIADDKKSFQIFATCQAKAGSVILEVPETLQHATNRGNTTPSS